MSRGGGAGGLAGLGGGAGWHEVAWSSQVGGARVGEGAEAED